MTYESDEMVGRAFGRLTAVARVGSDKWKSALWLCRCRCGRETTASASKLVRGERKSCGCLKLESIAYINADRRGST